jgi:hypothetical protein
LERTGSFLKKILSVFLIISFGTVLLGCTPASPPQTEPKVPEPQEVVDRFLTAISSGNYEEAWNLQSQNLKEQATLEDFKNSLEQYKKYFGVSKQTWEIKEAVVEGDSARIKLILNTYFQNGTSAVRESQYLLKLEGGNWKIDQLLETP